MSQGNVQIMLHYKPWKPTNAGKGFQVAWPTVNEVVARKGDALAKKLPCPVLSGKKPYVSVTR